MSNYTFSEKGVCAPKGFQANGIYCGIRKNHTKKDLAMIFSTTPCQAAAMYTQNKVCGAPITVTRHHLENGIAQAVIVNSGIANTCNADGVEKATAMCQLTGSALGISPYDVIVASTGVIGQPLPLEPIESTLPALVESLSCEGGESAAQAIMTTDVIKKECSVSFDINGKTVTIGAMAKGSGMIQPNMATMLCFVTSDAAISCEMLTAALHEAVADSFNMVSIDGDTSTNDMVSVMANGQAENAEITQKGEEYALFANALKALLIEMAKKIAGDGEGATKLLACTVEGAPTIPLAKKIAKSVINSSLVKTAVFGADANWGRILCAIGYTEGDFSADCIDVHISSPAGRIQVCVDSFGVPFSEEEAKKILLEKEISIEISMKQGEAAATAWGCDLTYDYVKINGDYRT